ncbi:dolichol phosphate-mannose biosynthesis regulatory protein-domain-containing protein [Thamnocephalis sphaerospora]|uniref:Dolichol phosphate-mannose biosynthesis regulatory protein n=1 Tax=Thamnocephalis sphaerospora TaxID=78915 RepID=A0A4P9XIW6_9FUNG|nr:dolichol phosphate-mannose biosynthesis regulatory protein-domain-containing protein [Thamnocephalis sphaerospora]|eukprot:RKP05140.1 dolichol phosphate-mannose biosynthesis regulatory protein-domain-containing protein [Thamnocephalis sphaerospora]
MAHWLACVCADCVPVVEVACLLVFVANGSDVAVGGTLLLISVSVFTYYTLWTLLMPFVDEDHALHSYFPPREYAIKIPVALLLVGLTGVFTFLASVMIRSGKKKQKTN